MLPVGAVVRDALLDEDDKVESWAVLALALALELELELVVEL